jgi:hypothetical protein
LLSVSTDAKTVKGEKIGYLTGILYLSPAKESGVMNTCPNASAGCAAACLYTAGRSVAFPKINQARVKRTIFLKSNRVEFITQLENEINSLIKRATKKGLIPVVRLNGTSDIPFENMGIIEKFPNIIFYDYTKSVKRVKAWLNGELPANYHLTFSRSETNGKDAAELAKLGANVAVVYSSKKLPKTFHGRKVVSGDDSDLRFLDPPRRVIGLSAKGKAKHDTSGFVVKVRAA